MCLPLDVIEREVVAKLGWEYTDTDVVWHNAWYIKAFMPELGKWDTESITRLW